MGSERFEIDVIWDTGSSWVVINEASCDWTCQGLVYDASTSTDFEEIPGAPLKEKIYGLTYVQGYEVYDSVCILD